MNDIKRFFADKLRALHDIRAEPEAVAGGVAIGMFMGFTPFIGFKTLLAILLAWLARCSKIAAVIAVTLHDVLILFAPVLVWIEYHIGNWVLQRPPHAPIPHATGHGLSNLWHHWASFWNWEFFLNYVYPVFIGSIVIGLPFAIASYFVTHGFLARVRARREAAEAATRAAGAAVDPNDI